MPDFDVSHHDGYLRMLRYLRRRRQQLHLTQAAVAYMMGTAQSEISRLERGYSDPQVSTIRRYIHVLDLHSRMFTELAVPHPDCQLKDKIHGVHPVRELRDRCIVCYGSPDLEEEG